MMFRQVLSDWSIDKCLSCYWREEWITFSGGGIPECSMVCGLPLKRLLHDISDIRGNFLSLLCIEDGRRRE